MNKIGILLVTLFFFTGCNYFSESSSEIEDQENQVIIDEKFLELAANGKLKGCDYTISTENTGQKIRTELGTPEWEGYYEGGYGLLYGDCTYYTVDEGTGPIAVIDLNGQEIFFSTFEIKDILGEPIEEGFSDIDSTWYLYYQAGDYDVYFSFDDENGKMLSIRLKAN